MLPSFPTPRGAVPRGDQDLPREGDMTCFQVGREQSGQIGAVGAYGSSTLASHTSRFPSVVRSSARPMLDQVDFGAVPAAGCDTGGVRPASCWTAPGRLKRRYGTRSRRRIQRVSRCRGHERSRYVLAPQSPATTKITGMYRRSTAIQRSDSQSTIPRRHTPSSGCRN